LEVFMVLLTAVRQETTAVNRGLALLLLCVGSFVVVLDVTITAIALPSIQRDLRFSTSGVQWILSGYAVSFASLLLLLGRAADLYGRRRLFVIGLAIFGLASLLGGLAWEPWVLLAGRVLQGVGGAALTPASLAMVASIFDEGEKRNRAMGLYGATTGIGFICGMVLGGLITEFLGWRWILFVNVPVVLVTIALASSVIPESRRAESSRHLDLMGAATAALGFASLVYAVSTTRRNGWTSPETLGIGAIGALFLMMFVQVERRSSVPLLPLGIVTRRSIIVPNTTAILLSMVGASQLLVLTLYFQDGLGRSPLETGLLFVPMTLASVIASPIAGYLTTRLGVKRTSVVGYSLLAIGLLLVMARLTASQLSVVVLGGMVVAEAGFMTARVPLTVAATGAVGEQERGLASGILGTATEIGNAFGWATVAAVIAATTGAEEASTSALVEGFRWGIGVAVIFAILALITAMFMPRETALDSDGE
jgi:EmrB/QacA subfamily drug resistance transporter